MSRGAQRACALATLVACLAIAIAPHPARADNQPSFVSQDAFIAAHPDLYWRREGARNHARGRYSEAMTAFRRAARYADKPSQAVIAQMLWNGEGVAADRAMAYVWADLAAERGYPDFIATREKFWLALSAEQRERAVAIGGAVFDEFADTVAKPREERALRRARQQITGSRTGRPGTISVFQYDHATGNFDMSDGALYYDARYWSPELYWQWQDRPWKPDPRGKVEIGPIQASPTP
ncbi:MAG: sel1 repeat family protein [Dokdonella sp.]|nr:sel1 repeat family protein [Dokdonella sp.]